MITKKDIPCLRQLWQQAFGDSDAFLDKFFRVGFSFDRCRCIRQEREIAAALYWFDCTWNSKKVAYIYAVATDKAHRGKGLCRRLLEDTHAHLRAGGYAGAVLVPGSEALAGMYAKFGYRAFCPIKRASGQIPEKATQIPAAKYAALRQSFLDKNTVFHGAAALNFFATYGAFFQTEAGAFCGYQDSGVFHFEEVLGENFLQQIDSVAAMYLPLDGDPTTPGYFAISLN